MERCASWIRLSTIAPLAACILLTAHRGALGAPTPDAGGGGAALQEGQIIVSFEAGESVPRRVYGPTRAGRIEGTEGKRYFRFRYSTADAASLPSHMIPHSGYLVDAPSVPVHANSVLAFRYRSDGVTDLRLALKLTNQSLQWFLNLRESAEWTQMSLPLTDKFTRPVQGASTESVRITTFARLPENRETAFMDVDDFRLERAAPVSSAQRGEMDEALRKRAHDEEMLKQYMRVRNLRTDKDTYRQGERIAVRYDIVNTSDRRLTVPLSTQFTRPVHRIGAVQTWIEPLDDGAKTTDFGGARRRGPRYAAGGAIFPMSGGPDHLEPGQALHSGRTIRTRLQPGRYRYYVEFKAIDGTQVNEEHTDFTVLPPGGWTRIWGPVGTVVVNRSGAIFATETDSGGDLHKLVGMPAQWARVGAPGRMLAAGPPTDEFGSGLYALSHDGSGIWRMGPEAVPSLAARGTPPPGGQKGWTKVGGPAKHIYGGGAGLFATNPGTGDIYRYRQGTGAWEEVGGPGRTFAVGARDLYGLAPDGARVYQYTGTAMSWRRIGGPARSIYAGGDKLFATNPNTGDVYEYTGSPMKWRKIGGPCTALTVDNMGNLYRLSGDESGVYRYTGTPMEWTWIGGPAGKLWGAYASRGGGRWVLATDAETGDLGLHENREDPPLPGPPSGDEAVSSWHEAEAAYQAGPPSNARAQRPLEAEALPIEVENPAKCYIAIQQMQRWGPHVWSGDAQVFCGSQRGGAVTLRFPIEESGDYELAFYATRAPDYGIAEMSLDGEPVGAPFDGYAPAVIPSGRVLLDTVSLASGEHLLRFEAVDRNDRASRFHLGIDCIELRRVGR